MRYVILLLLSCASYTSFALAAPDFTATDTDGTTHSLYSDYINQDKLVVIEFFFTSCPPCATHAPLVEILYQDMLLAHGDNVEFFLVTTLNSDNDTKVANYLTSKNLSMPAISADGGAAAIRQPYQAGTYGDFYATPTFMVIAPGSGEVFFDIRGLSAQQTIDQLEDLINQLLIPAPPGLWCDLQDSFGEGIDGVEMHAGVSGWDTAFVADQQYQFAGMSNLEVTIPFEMYPYKNDDPLNGVSTYDLVLISKSILGLEPLSQPWQQTAADINNSGSVTTFDIVEGRKLILGIYSEFPNRPSWVFMPDTATELNAYCVPFTGIKIGDVNGSAISNSNIQVADDRGTSLPLTISQTAQMLTISSIDAMDVEGIQLALTFDPRKVRIKAVHSNLNGFDFENFHVLPNELRISWTGPSATIRESDPLFEIEVESLGSEIGPNSIVLSPGTIASEIYRTDGRHPLTMEWTNAEAVRIFPNPAESYFVLSNLQGREGDLIEILDPLGRSVYQLQIGKMDEKSLRVQPGSELPSGVYWVRLGDTLLGQLQWK